MIMNGSASHRFTTVQQMNAERSDDNHLAASNPSFSIHWFNSPTGSGFHTILTYAYENAFITNNYGFSSAISIIIFILLIVFSARFQLREEGDL